MEELVEKVVAPYEEILSEQVGKLCSPLHRMTLNEAPMDKLITDAYQSFTGADLAFSNGWRYGPPVLPGNIKVKELYQIIPANPELFTLELEGRELVNELEKNSENVFAPDPFNQKGGYILRSSGLFMAFKPYNPAGNRIQHIEVQGSPLQSDKVYRIAGGGKQIFKAYDSRKGNKNVRAIELLKEYFIQQEKVRIEMKPTIISI
ncbi:5'-nucleotidase [Aneurinibacillus sp. Ricciae_BoGa-3]|uniref:5'-nucleotidase C-terminal domain-containing protein n=1 Tax=Aneurinibacillus sp. Ricciae_BoGa-3 TaxID=3022697 RepID=UPI0023421E6B|nr:5'-nucleotidase [Aneurinibacillus sp. Ricciae_BoGa-3]WCK56489.1 5'-nucleotidase [Aneurinibacillus sp. Ricciae_BoGa-3]